MLVCDKLFLKVLLLCMFVFVKIYFKIDFFFEMVIVIIGVSWEFCMWYVNLFFDWMLRCFMFIGCRLRKGFWMLFD